MAVAVASEKQLWDTNGSKIRTKLTQRVFDRMEISAILGSLHTATDFRGVNAAACVEVEKADFDGYKQAQLQVMLNSLPSQCDQKFKDDAKTKIGGLLDMAKFSAAGASEVEMVGLNFDFGGDQCVVGWAIAFSKNKDTGTIHLAYSEAGRAWTQSRDYKLDKGYWSSAAMSMMLTNYVHFEAYAGLARLLEQPSVPESVISSQRICSTCGRALKPDTAHLHQCMTDMKAEVAMSGKLSSQVDFIADQTNWANSIHAEYRLTEVAGFLSSMNGRMSIIVCSNCGDNDTIKALLTRRAERVKSLLLSKGVPALKVPFIGHRFNTKYEVLFESCR